MDSGCYYPTNIPEEELKLKKIFIKRLGNKSYLSCFPYYFYDIINQSAEFGENDGLNELEFLKQI